MFKIPDHNLRYTTLGFVSNNLVSCGLIKEEWRNTHEKCYIKNKLQGHTKKSQWPVSVS
jgi:hypothetical protein